MAAVPKIRVEKIDDARREPTHPVVWKAVLVGSHTPMAQGLVLHLDANGDPYQPYYQWPERKDTWARILQLPDHLIPEVEQLWAEALEAMRRADVCHKNSIVFQFNTALRVLLKLESEAGSAHDLAPNSMRQQVWRIREKVEREQIERFKSPDPESVENDALTQAVEAVNSFDRHAQLSTTTALDYEVGNAIGISIDYHHLGGQTWRDWCLRHELDPAQPSSYRKMCDTTWWRRRLRKKHERDAEEAFIRVGQIDPTGHVRSPWISDEALFRGRAKDDLMVQIGACIKGISDDGLEVTCDKLFDRQARNGRQYAELMARCSGLKALAEERGDTYPILVTITAPSRFHPTTTWHPGTGRGPRRRNPRWDGSTPRDAHAWMQENWESFNDWKRHSGIGPYWVMGVQPMVDQTPHYHLVMYLKNANEAREVEEMLHIHFDVLGNNHAIDVAPIEGGTDGAVRYSAREIAYVSREIAEAHPGERDPDQAGDEAERASEWARVWGIRRFRTSHARATLWNMVRRSDLTIAANDPAYAAQAAAKESDFAGFLHASEGLKLVYERRETRYGDMARRIIGFCDTMTGELYQPTREWAWTRTAANADTATTSELCLTTKGEEEAAASGEDVGENAAGADPPDEQPPPTNNDQPVEDPVDPKVVWLLDPPKRGLRLWRPFIVTDTGEMSPYHPTRRWAA